MSILFSSFLRLTGHTWQQLATQMCITTLPAFGTGGGELSGGDVLMTCAPGTGGIATILEAGLEATEDAELLMESCW